MQTIDNQYQLQYSKKYIAVLKHYVTPITVCIIPFQFQYSVVYSLLYQLQQLVTNSLYAYASHLPRFRVPFWLSYTLGLTSVRASVPAGIINKQSYG